MTKDPMPTDMADDDLADDAWFDVCSEMGINIDITDGNCTTMSIHSVTSSTTDISFQIQYGGSQIWGAFFIKLCPSMKDFGFVHCHPKNVHRMAKN